MTAESIEIFLKLKKEKKKKRREISKMLLKKNKGHSVNKKPICKKRRRRRNTSNPEAMLIMVRKRERIENKNCSQAVKSSNQKLKKRIRNSSEELRLRRS